jgi:hypothetical protein
MTKIRSVEERVDWEAKFEIEFNHIKSTNKHVPAHIDTRDYQDIKNFITAILIAQCTALLTELRDSGLLEEQPETAQIHTADLRSLSSTAIGLEQNKGSNTLARAIKAHLNNLINPTSV